MKPELSEKNQSNFVEDLISLPDLARELQQNPPVTTPQLQGNPAGASGKLSSGIGMNNIENVKAVKKYVKTYADYFLDKLKQLHSSDIT